MADRNKKLKVMFKRYLRNNNKDAPPLTAAPPAPPEVCTLIKTDMTNVAQVRKIEDEEKEEFESVQGGCKPAISRVKKSKPLKWKFGGPSSSDVPDDTKAKKVRKRPKSEKKEVPSKEVLEDNPTENYDSNYEKEGEAEEVVQDDKTFETAVSVLTVLKRNQLMERSLTFAETTTIAKFFSGNSEKPDEKIVKILDKAIGNALFVLANRPNEVDDVIDNQMRSFVMDPDKAKTVLLEVMLSRSEFVPISWGGKGGDYIPDQKSKAVKRSSKTKTKDKPVDKPVDKTLDETVDDSDDQKKANAKKNPIKAHTPERKKKSDTKSKSETKISPANSGTNCKTKK